MIGVVFRLSGARKMVWSDQFIYEPDHGWMERGEVPDLRADKEGIRPLRINSLQCTARGSLPMVATARIVSPSTPL